MKYREVFIFVVGTTPQIVTETLCAMLSKKPPIHPDEIFLITTTTGKKKIEEELLEKGRLYTFYKEFDLKPVSPNIILLTDRAGNFLDDIRTAEDNEDIGDFIVDFLREKTTDAGTRLHCSIAGGRKTMGFYLGSALTLLGRPWDKLYHVLVTPEFESHPDYYWKPRVERILEAKGTDGRVIKRLSTKGSKIYLAELPFIRLREKFTLNGRGFRDLVREGQKEIDIATAQMPLCVNIKERTIRIGEMTIEMVPMEIVIYTTFLMKKLKHCQYPGRPYCLDCTDCYPYLVDLWSRTMLEEMAEDYRKIYRRNTYRVDEFLKKWKEGIDVKTLRQYISKINRTIKEHLKDDTVCVYYTITAVGKYGDKRHGIRVEKGKIKII